ncbi:MAG: undecaprenyl-diphosphate phosphatase [Propionibacteriaceae bacterium]
MNWLYTIILGIVEGITEFLPVSSTAHLTWVESMLGLNIQDKGITAYTAVIQIGAIIAAIVYFWKDIVRLVAAWSAGLTNPDKRSNPDYRLGWGVILGVIPGGIAGLVGKKLIEGPLRSMWVVAIALIAWSVVLLLADRRGAQSRTEKDMTMKDAIILGLWQCIALIPGVSRSGATISGALLRDIDRETATRWSFFLGIPLLSAAGLFEALSAFGDISSTVGWGQTLVGTVISGLVAFLTIKWLLKFVASNKFTGFVVYRIMAGLVIIGLLATHVLTVAA